MVEVTWYPAHPCYGDVSMARYANLLMGAQEADDPFDCRFAIPPTYRERGSRFERLLMRKFLYPLQVSASSPGKIAHVLDHSWAHLLTSVRGNVAKVVTVHDLIPLRDPCDLTGAQVERFRGWVRHLENADAIISVSDYTKREVTELLGISPEKIFVVPNGADAGSVEPSVTTNVGERVKKGVSGLRVGSLGSTLKRKNLEVLPEALAKFAEATGEPVSLVRGGEMLPRALRDRFLALLGPQGLVELGRLSNHELEDFYRCVDVVVVPSKFEGFGLPVLEAMRRRKPVIAAASSSLPEVGGEAAVYFDPDSPEELALALEKVLDPERRQELVDLGEAWARQFTWRRSLEGLYQVYQQWD
ncbi:glycosyltransferase involved in cell wall biosynthesis [Haloferula luteola]|uniref:Glycosyltransferase involved in cell wall biosynthesis n=2 Tax=Haloferula luteola TaxID=595692 RepID=A0A840VAI9_9BACT|nr:glycosyltransferase involved in cell wall biosynthesis [Haloferula luteola]